MKKTIVIFTIISLVVVMLAGCATTPATTSAPVAASATVAPSTAASVAPSASQAATGTINVGWMEDLSGQYAIWGQAGLNGMKMAADAINAAGGVNGQQINVVGLDCQNDPQKSVNAYTQLVDQYHCVAVVGTNFSSCNIPVAAVADTKKVPVIGTAASNDLVTVDKDGNLNPYSFRLCFIDSYQGTVMAKYLLSQGYKNAAIITNEADAYSTGLTTYFTKAFTDGGGAIADAEQANGGDTDFRAQLSKIQSKKPDVFVIPWTSNDVANIAKQAKEIGLTCQMAGFDGWDDAQVPTLAAGSLEGGIYCSRPGFALPDAQAFATQYQAKYGLAPEAEALYGYDGLNWIVQCIKAANSTDPTVIKDQLEKTTSFNGLLGPMSVDPKTHNPSRQLAIFKVVGDKEVYQSVIQ